MEAESKNTNEKKIEYLKRYGEALKMEEILEEEIRQLRLDKMLPSLHLDGMPRGKGIRQDLSGYAAKISELLEDLKLQLEKRIQIRKEISRQIEAMNSETEKMILRLRYIHLLKWEDISEKTGYTYRHTIRLHKEAINNFRMS